MENSKIPSDNHLQSLLSKRDFLVLVAKSGGKVIGGLTVYILNQYYSSKPLAYMYDVGILTDYQRKGIGKKLISYFTNYCQENDFEEAYVEAQVEDINAIQFYNATAISSKLQATHFTYSFDK